MLFEIPKVLLSDALKRIGPAMVESMDPAEKGQYLIMNGKGSTLKAWIKRQEVTAVVEVNSADLKIGEEFTNTVQGKALYDVLAKVTMSGVVKAEFEANQNKDAAEEAEEAEEEGGEDGEPAQEPVPNIGNVLFMLPSTRKQPEKLRIPSVQWSANPDIQLNGSQRIKLGAELLASMISKVEIAFDKQAKVSMQNCLIRTKGDRCQLVMMSSSALAKIDGPFINATGDFEVCVNFEQLQKTVKMLDDSTDVEIIVNDGTPGTMIFAQELQYGDAPVGKSYLRISCSKDKFTPYEKTLDKVSYRYHISIKKQQLCELCGKLEAVGGDNSKVTTKFTPDVATYVLSKAGQKGSIEGLVLDVADANGDPFEFKSVSRHWKSVGDKAMVDDIKVSLAGKNQLLKASLGDGYEFYFQSIGI